MFIYYMKGRVRAICEMVTVSVITQRSSTNIYGVPKVINDSRHTIDLICDIRDLLYITDFIIKDEEEYLNG